MNCDIRVVPHVDRKRVNKGKQDKSHNTAVKELSFDQFLSFCSPIKVRASSKARMMTGDSLETCNSDEGSFLAFNDSVSL